MPYDDRPSTFMSRVTRDEIEQANQEEWQRLITCGGTFNQEEFRKHMRVK